MPGSQTRTPADALRRTIELAQAAEDIGVDGAFVRVHHFERQLTSPFPLLSAITARTSRIEIGTALFTVPNQPGVAYNARILQTITKHVAPAIGWTPAANTPTAAP